MKFNQHSSSPPNCKNIDSSSSTLSISVGSNLTQLNSNKSIERMKPDNLINCVSGGMYNTYTYKTVARKNVVVFKTLNSLATVFCHTVIIQLKQHLWFLLSQINGFSIYP